MAPVPAATCNDCEYAWNSAAMAEGLRLIGSCPRCGGGLSFREAEAAPAPAPDPEVVADAPHLVLGVPRR